jgi:hypothetical protein
METQFHEIDPEGDIIIKLRASSSTFATWNEEPNHPPPPPQLRSPSEIVDKPEDEDELEAVPVPEPVTDRPISALAEREPSDDEWNVEIRVSSRHLILASPQAKRMLEGAWMEQNTLKSQGFLVIEEKDWDNEALLILMNIMHGKNRSVPKKISLEMLGRIAVLVDYYECYEVVEIFSDMWIAHLKEELPETYSRKLVLWICISWVFRQPAEFKMATSVALKHSEGMIETMELPIPERIVRKSSLIALTRHS